MGYTAAELLDKVTLGADAIFRVATPAAGNTMPAAANFKELCLASEMTVGFETSTISFKNLCTRGQDLDIPTGQKGVIDLSEMQWIKDDAALLVMETAAENKTPVAYEFLPEGAGVGKVVYRGFMNVLSWKIKAVSDGLVTVENPTISAAGVPEKGELT